MQFDFSTTQRIIFGWGALDKLPSIISKFGTRAFLIYSKSVPAVTKIENIFNELQIKWHAFTAYGEPTDKVINQVTAEARDYNCDFVVSIGGGSVIDTGKAVSALLTNEGDLLDYLEVVGKGMPIKNLPKPYIAIPATAGTGSEVTRNAVIKITNKKVKVSMRNPWLLPSVALVDPQLTVSVPPKITASTGMDAFTQVIEPYVSRFSNQLVDLYCKEGIEKAAKSLLKAYEYGDNQEARTNMAWVSLLGGLSLANAKLGAVHGFAGPIGGMFKAPHGTICASLLPSVIEVNVRALREREPQNQKVARFEEIAKIITQDSHAKIRDGIEWIKKLKDKLHIPQLLEFNIHKRDFSEIISKSKRSSSMKGNPITLTDGELWEILEMAL
ncbi:MAG TPA: iron-containing alcohol dehydrogenase [Anaerolineae bacterium]|nr:iron-containing alcohol dehydrogenase [Anaerolineae bacterium]